MNLPTITKEKIRDWGITIIIGAVVILLGYLYYQLTKEGGEGRRLWSRLTADTGMIIIGISFLMSSLSFYIGGIFKKGLRLRQHIGLLGFYVTLVHVYITLDFALHNPQIAFSTNMRVISFSFGLAALIVFLHMFIISNKTAMKVLGSKAWRIFLRLGGYSAFIYVFIHYVVRKTDLWKEWWNGDLSIFPPLTIILTIFMAVIFIMRIALWFSLKNENSTSSD